MKKRLSLVILSVGILGISSTSAMEQELAQPLTITDVSMDVFENIISQIIAENGPIYNRKKVTAVIKELCKIRGTCRMFRAGLAPERIRHALQNVGVDLNNILHKAAFFGDVECLEALLAIGVGVNVVDGKGQTVLRTAVGNGHTECLRLLLAAGANVGVVSRSGYTDLHCAAIASHSECLKLLLSAGEDVNIVEPDGKTALYWAVRNGDLVSLRALLAAGADVSATDRDGSTALHWVTERDAAQILVNHYIENGIGIPEDLKPKLRRLGVTTPASADAEATLDSIQ